jgi:hypothetical protein
LASLGDVDVAVDGYEAVESADPGLDPLALAQLTALLAQFEERVAVRKQTLTRS